MIKLQLIPVEQNMDIPSRMDDPAKSALKMTLEYYKTIGFDKPWISYLAKIQDDFVGLCAFKGKPKSNKVEIAYFTFPSYEGKGIASEMCKQLISIAQKENRSVCVTARTLPEENASTAVLKKNGFVVLGTVTDPEDGEVFEWAFNK